MSLHPYTRELLLSLCYLEKQEQRPENLKSVKTSQAYSRAAFHRRSGAMTICSKDRTASRGFWQEKRPLLAVRKGWDNAATGGQGFKNIFTGPKEAAWYRHCPGSGRGCLRTAEGETLVLSVNRLREVHPCQADTAHSCARCRRYYLQR